MPVPTTYDSRSQHTESRPERPQLSEVFRDLTFLRQLWSEREGDWPADTPTPESERLRYELTEANRTIVRQERLLNITRGHVADLENIVSAANQNSIQAEAQQSSSGTVEVTTESVLAPALNYCPGCFRLLTDIPTSQSDHEGDP